MKKIKIAVLVSNPCIIDARVIRISEKEASLGYDVKVFATLKDRVLQNETINSVSYERKYWDLSKYCRKYIPKIIKIKKVKGFLVKRLAKYLKYFSFSETFFLEVMEFSPDIIHSHDLVCLPLGVKLKQHLNAKLIYDAHELEVYRNPPLPWYEKIYVGYIEKKYAKSADCIITVNDSIANILKYNLKNKNIYTIKNTPILNKYNGKSMRKLINLTNNETILLYVGKLSLNRGIEWVIEQLSANQEIHFVCVGHQDKKFLDKIMELAKKHNVTDRFYLIDPVPHNEVVDFIKEADIGICAINPVTKSYYYSLPNKVFEMSIAGLPVIATDLPEIRSFLDGIGNGFYFSHNNSEDITKLIAKILEEKKANNIDQKKISDVAKKFSWENESKKIEDILNVLR